MIQAEIQHISSNTNGEYDNLRIETKTLVTMTSSTYGTDVVFYQACREDIQTVADTLNEWLGRN